MVKFNFLVFLLYILVTTWFRSLLIFLQSSACKIEREDSLEEGLDSFFLLNLARIILGFKGDILTVLHEDRIFFNNKACSQAG
jgi:hypothetical protein